MGRAPEETKSLCNGMRRREKYRITHDRYVPSKHGLVCGLKNAACYDRFPRALNETGEILKALSSHRKKQERQANL